LIKNIKDKINQYELTPRQTRYLFHFKGWSNVVGFHTRNIPHRAHEHIQKQALEMTIADGLFINPVVGGKKAGDFFSEVIMESYKILIKDGIYPNNQVVLGCFPTYSRYSGPREAVFTAICRKNMGCNYFIVGRDHTGVGNYYNPEDSQKYFDKMDDLVIEPVFFDEIGYDVIKRKYFNINGSKNIKSIDATSYRKSLLKFKKVPNWYVRDSVQDMLINKLKNGEEVFHH